MTIKAIETRYKGYRFRSRLEARWAVFFDAFPLKWEYEPEGFDLGAEGYYLPDFYLPEMDMWVEVKPDVSLINGERDKIEVLAAMTGKQVLLAKGTPALRNYDICYPETLYMDGQGPWEEVCFCEKYLPPRNHDSTPRLFLSPGGDLADCVLQVEAARSARFEHGEVPV